MQRVLARGVIDGVAQVLRRNANLVGVKSYRAALGVMDFHKVDEPSKIRWSPTVSLSLAGLAA